jgi:two-component system, NarL family, sensor kinase
MSDRSLSLDRRSLQSSSIVGLVLLILIFEFNTPVDYLFGYLYTAPILLTNFWFGRRATIYVTALAIGLTLLNIWVPLDRSIAPSTIFNRALAGLALFMTGWLSEKNRHDRHTLIVQQSQLNVQKQLSRLREDFASTLTHDLKTPLLGGIAAIEAFQAEKFGNITEMQQQVLGLMSRSHHNSLQLVETLLDVYRNDTEGLKLTLVPVDLVEIAEEVLCHLSPLAAADRIYLNLNYGASDFRQSLWVNGDRFQLQRVFTNLLKNAIDHSRKGDRVDIILESQAHQHVIKIIDSGSGITPTELPNLFQRFYQGHSDRQAKGTGLGLYLCRQIIEAHRGIIWAENRSASPSDATPHGALFGFRLPSYPHSPPIVDR